MKKENEKNNNINNDNNIDKTKRNNDKINIRESKIQENDYKVSIKECDTQDNNECEEYNNKYCLNEKKIIIYLIILSLVLLYYSLFFIHNLNFRGVIKDTQLVEIRYPQNNNEMDNSIDINNSQSNTIANIIEKNNTTNSITNNNITNGNLSNNTNNNIGNENSNNNVNNNTGNGETNNPGGNIVDNKDRFKIMQGTESWKDLKSLDIFNNYYFNDNSVIAPGVSGKYSFTVENYRETKMQYNLNFVEQNIYNINMVYKLKLNGSYIAGNEREYVKYKELNKEGLLINANTNDILTIEWKWLDNKNDTQIGKTEGANYRMQITINASELEN